MLLFNTTLPIGYNTRMPRTYLERNPDDAVHTDTYGFRWFGFTDCHFWIDPGGDTRPEFIVGTVGSFIHAIHANQEVADELLAVITDQVDAHSGGIIRVSQRTLHVLDTDYPGDLHVQTPSETIYYGSGTSDSWPNHVSDLLRGGRG